MIEVDSHPPGAVHPQERGDNGTQRRLGGELGHRNRTALQETGHDATRHLVHRHDLRGDADSRRGAVGGDFSHSVDPEQLGVRARDAHDDILACDGHLVVRVRDAAGERLDREGAPGPEPVDDLGEDVSHRPTVAAAAQAPVRFLSDEQPV